MPAYHRGSSFVAFLAALNLCVPWQAVYAAEPAGSAVDQSTAIEVLDVALGEGGLLTGEVYDAAGTLAAGAEVALIRNGSVLVSATTDRSGVVRFSGVPGGTYQLASSSEVALVRAWAPHTAPPSARPAAMLVEDQTVVRGQYGCADSVGKGGHFPPRHAGRAYGGRPVMNWLRTHPGMVMAGVAAAIAVPVAIAASDDDDPPSS